MLNHEGIWEFKRVGDRWIPKVIVGDIRRVAPHLPDNFVDCVITSPPYWMQRDYGHEDQIGREGTPEEYVNEIAKVFEMLRVKLRRTATVFLNVGYKYLNGELILVPEMVALEMRRRGFVLKNKIVWWKPNAMPTSARDRLNNVYEPVLLFVREDGKVSHYFNLEEVSQRSKTFEQYLDLLSIDPEDLLGARVIDPISDRKRRRGKVIGVRFSSKRPVEVLIMWEGDGEEWIAFGDPLKSYPEEVAFECPLCGARISEWDIRLSFSNLNAMMCPECGSDLCRSPDTFPLPKLTEAEREGLREVIDPAVGTRKYITRNPGNSKFLRAGVAFTASPAGRLAIQGEYVSIKRRWAVPQLLIAEFLRYWRSRRQISVEDLDEKLGYSYTAGHWFRSDFGWWGKGGSLPRPSDWIRLKELLGFSGVYDRVVTERVAVLQTVKPHEEGRNPGDVWEIALERYPEAHFSVFPRKLVERAIRIGCPPRGVVLDPFAGSGTVGEVAMRLGRKVILVELVPRFLRLIRGRCGEIEVIREEVLRD
ncbi:MAG: site-specific DNA-methyltransferase [Candidatus Korarchaeum sp.]